MATDVGAKSIDSCVESKTYRPWVKYTTQEAAVIGVTGTPTVFVDGKQWGKGDSAQTPIPGLRRRSHQRPRPSRPARLSRRRPGSRILPGAGPFRRVFTSGRPWANLV